MNGKIVTAGVVGALVGGVAVAAFYKQTSPQRDLRAACRVAVDLKSDPVHLKHRSDGKYTYAAGRVADAIRGDEVYEFFSSLAGVSHEDPARRRGMYDDFTRWMMGGAWKCPELEELWFSR